MAATSSALVLAAGGARRMGCCKALLPVGGRPLLLWHLDVLGAVVDEVVIVTGAYLDEINAAVADHPVRPRWAHNPDWAQTDMAASLRLGVEACRGERVLCLPCDSLPAANDALRALLGAAGTVALGHRGAPGHPLCADKAALRAAAGSGGLRALHPALIEAGDGRCLVNLNAPEDILALSALGVAS
ncbi:MAG: NTP transferase domain-containing protein [Deltaproteobacteria bacterium]|jgi:CTP:molybdopterin cytidylyltransferase MocA|nr:NTP transferase domain-containing protein [Deltaproteobacteria bacterium]